MLSILSCFLSFFLLQSIIMFFNSTNLIFTQDEYIKIFLFLFRFPCALDIEQCNEMYSNPMQCNERKLNPIHFISINSFTSFNSFTPLHEVILASAAVNSRYQLKHPSNSQLSSPCLLPRYLQPWSVMYTAWHNRMRTPISIPILD